MPRSSCRQQLTNLSIRQQRRSVNSSKQEDLKNSEDVPILLISQFSKNKTEQDFLVICCPDYFQLKTE